MNKPKQYVLRQPVQVDLALNVEDHVAVYIDPYIECFEMRLASFESAFVSVEDIQQQIESIVAEARLQFQVNLQAAENEGMLSEQLMEEDRITEQVVVRQLLGVFYGKEKP